MEDIRKEDVKATLEALKRNLDWQVKNYLEDKYAIKITEEEIVIYIKLVIRLDKKLKHKSKPKQLELMV